MKAAHSDGAPKEAKSVPGTVVVSALFRYIKLAFFRFWREMGTAPGLDGCKPGAVQTRRIVFLKGEGSLQAVSNKETLFNHEPSQAGVVKQNDGGSAR